ncbi:MAG: Ribosomal RNA small subunit methyltransferase H [Chlamydiales bacterium]|nr:Ribosomal RNA small subunit methyltransferase H [Chlamydiales bacterium]MCH9635515.1 Ribosomal RNA small subunit methyltransferase H [Chlamydiales bacterium]
MSIMGAMHKSVLLEEIISFFAIPMESFLDGTLGLGGHAEAILEQHPELKSYFGIDKDPEALALAKQRLGDRLIGLHGSFGDLDELVDSQVDGILLDLGVSSLQLDKAEKGFSFMRDGPLDMRMNPEADIDAAAVVNSYSERDLGRIFQEYGEERRWRQAAKAIVQARRKKRLETTFDLCHALEQTLKRSGKIHPMTRVFQALRIEVNGELDVLKEVIPKAIAKLRPGGRLAIISFHSLEDRIVKYAFRHFMVEEKMVNILTKKPQVATFQECRKNPRARSAKLRVLEKL